MVKAANQEERVRLALADWCALGSLALTLLMMVGGTLYTVHEWAGENRQRLALLESHSERTGREIGLFREELRELAEVILALRDSTDRNGNALLSRSGYMALLKAYQEADQRARVAVYEWLKGFAAKQGYPPPPRPSRVAPPDPPVLR